MLLLLLLLLLLLVVVLVVLLRGPLVQLLFAPRSCSCSTWWQCSASSWV